MRIGSMIGALAAAGLLAAGVATAETPYETRKAVMKENGEHMKALGAIAKGEAKFNADTAAHAQALVANSKALTDKLTALFPEGSGGGKSRAKEEIWADWPAFQKAAADFEAAAPMLVPAAESGDPAKLGAALKQVGQTCGGCHKPFRKPET